MNWLTTFNLIPYKIVLLICSIFPPILEDDGSSAGVVVQEISDVVNFPLDYDPARITRTTISLDVVTGNLCFATSLPLRTIV
jgi:hypothetical protein